MFNRTLQMKLTKDDKVKTPSPTQTENIYDYELVINNTIRNVGKGVAAYVILDTFRRVATELATK